MTQRIPETHKHRYKLLKISTDLGLPASTLLRYTDPMRGKTEEEKELIALEAIKDIEQKALKNE